MRFLFPFLFASIALVGLTACDKPVSAKRAETDPCHLPYLNGSKNFVASIYAYEGKGKTKLKKWSNGNRHTSIRLDPPVDGFPKNLDAVLVLSAYEPVEWKISPALAAKTNAVLVGGYHRQRVTGLKPETPVMMSSYEALSEDDGTSCRTLQPLYADNSDAKRHETTAALVHSVTGLGLDRISEQYSAEQIFIPPFQKPYALMNDDKDKSKALAKRAPKKSSKKKAS